jgi:starvation-inducible DNA-binding protein
MNNNTNINSNNSTNMQNQMLNYLNQFLSNIAVLTNKMYNYHWNITGPHFFTIHSKFKEYYEKGNEMFDEVAERIRQLDGFPITSLAIYESTAGIRASESKKYSGSEAVTNTISDFKYIHRVGSDIASYAESIGDGATKSIIGEYLTYLEKQLWMLEANLK